MDICKFLNESYTSYHATANVCKMLDEKGFKRIPLGEAWQIEVGGSYYVVQNGSSVVAFKVGKNKVFNICESHTDSPAFKVKGNSVVGADLKRLNTESYGGALLYSYFDRPLKVAGRVVVETATGVETQLVESSYNVVIPSLAVHHNPSVNEGVKFNLQNDTLPLFTQGDIDVYASLTNKRVLDGDLYVVPAASAFCAGAEEEFLCSARIDNLTSVYTSVVALAESSPKGIAVVACLDNEEIGSCTRQGSAEFLALVLKQLEESLKFSAVQSIAARENGMVVSVDNGHAAHPAHLEKNDPQIFAKLNGGIVIKHNPRYATDGLTAAVFKRLLEKGNVPFQDYYNRSDVRCGTTLGLSTARILQMKTCDIGLAQLAMHSACETVGAKDIVLMQKALCLFLSADLRRQEGKVEIL